MPRGTIFLQSETEEDARSAQAVEDSSVSVSQMVPVLFYPDGSSQDAVLILRNEKENEVKLTLRGLTGQASVRPVER